MKQTIFLLLAICSLHTASSALTCADSSQNFSDEIEYCLNNPWPMIIVYGKIIEVEQDHSFNKDYMSATMHADFALKVQVTHEILGEISTDTIVVIPGPPFLARLDISKFKVNSSWVFLLQLQVNEIWKELNYPSNLYLGKICGYPFAHFSELESEGMSLELLSEKFEDYDSKVKQAIYKKK